MEVRVRYRDTDSTGRIFFSRYLEFFDDAISEFFREKGVIFSTSGSVTLDNHAKDEIFVVGDCYCRFLHESFYDDILEATLEIEEFREKKVKFLGTFHNKTRGNICARGNMSLICLQADTHETTPIPADILARLRARQ